MQSKGEEVLLCSIPSQRVYPVSFRAPLPWATLHWPAPLLVIRMWSLVIRLPGSARSRSFSIVHCLHHRRNPTFLVSSVPPADAAWTWDGSWGWTPLAKNLAFLWHLGSWLAAPAAQDWRGRSVSIVHYRRSTVCWGIVVTVAAPRSSGWSWCGKIFQLGLDYQKKWDYISNMTLMATAELKSLVIPVATESV